MAKDFYGARFCRGVDDDDPNLIAITTTSVVDEVDFEIVALPCGACDGAPGLFHAHFTAPIACTSQVARAAAQRQLDPFAVLELCEIALAQTHPTPCEAAI